MLFRAQKKLRSETLAQIGHALARLGTVFPKRGRKVQSHGHTFEFVFVFDFRKLTIPNHLHDHDHPKQLCHRQH